MVRYFAYFSLAVLYFTAIYMFGYMALSSPTEIQIMKAGCGKWIAFALCFCSFILVTLLEGPKQK